MKRLVLAITVVALLAALIAPAAQAQGYWYWCWNDSHGYWEYCWWEGNDWDGDGIVQESEAGEMSQTFTIS